MAVTRTRRDDRDESSERQFYLPANTASTTVSYVERMLRSLFRRRGDGLRVVVRKR